MQGLYTFGFVDDVMFSYGGPMAQRDATAEASLHALRRVRPNIYAVWCCLHHDSADSSRQD